LNGSTGLGGGGGAVVVVVVAAGGRTPAAVVAGGDAARSGQGEAPISLANATPAPRVAATASTPNRTRGRRPDLFLTS
jgi:hypothetical protein